MINAIFVKHFGPGDNKIQKKLFFLHRWVKEKDIGAILKALLVESVC